MNAHIPPQRTAAETALIDAFGARFSDLPGDPVVVGKRDDAIEQIKAGLPTRHVEAWHYTDLRRLLAKVPDAASVDVAKAAAPLLSGSAVLSVLNGATNGSGPAIEGATITLMADKLRDGSIAPALGVTGADDAVGALNVAFAGDGYFVDIADGAELSAPIELQNVQAGGQTHVRSAVRAGAGSKATIVQRETGSGDALVTSVTNLTVGEGAEVMWIIVQDQPDSASHLGQFNASIGKNARLTLFVMNEGGRLVRQEIRVRADGEGADFQLRGVNLMSGDSHTDVTMVLDHAVPHTGSRERVRNVVLGRAHGVFQGRINVHQPAQKTDAKMSCNTLLLSDDAEFDTKPELEIFADDVVCGHGATVTEIDKNHLFYLMARGVDEKSARGLLVKAFVAEIIEDLEVEPVVEALEARLETWFATHG
ncbi:MAG: Fe-S cluster assembly protein SufD [Mesorhizobium sp.]